MLGGLLASLQGGVHFCFLLHLQSPVNTAVFGDGGKRKISPVNRKLINFIKINVAQMTEFGGGVSWLPNGFQEPSVQCRRMSGAVESFEQSGISL